VPENDKPLRGTSLAGRIPPDCAAIMVYTTFPDIAAAEALGRKLVEDRLAACVNILPGMISIYAWQGEIERAGEVVLIAKTAVRRAEALMRALIELHPYEVPAVLAIPVLAGAEGYLNWTSAGVDVPSED